MRKREHFTEETADIKTTHDEHITAFGENIGRYIYIPKNFTTTLIKKITSIIKIEKVYVYSQCTRYTQRQQHRMP